MAYYKDIRDLIAALEQANLLVRVNQEINKDTELHPLVRLQFRGLPESERKAVRPRPGDATAARRGPVVAVPPRRSSAIVSARAPKRRGVTMGKVELTHPDRELWPGITKQDLADYYRAVWDVMAPHLVGRPLSLLRCPDGTQGQCFFQKHASAGLSEEKIQAVPHWQVADCFSPVERAVLADHGAVNRRRALGDRPPGVGER